MSDRLVIDERFRGFEGIAHGGYVGGLLAQELGDSVEVKLRKSPPMGRPLTVEKSAKRVQLRDGDTVVAEGATTGVDITPPHEVTLAEAEQASGGYPGLRGHLYPECFGCGPGRAAGDGLRVFPGPIEGTDVVAAAWAPDRAFADEAGTVGTEIAWAAVDCPQLWAMAMNEPAESEARAVTSALAGRAIEPLKADQRYAVIAWPMRGDDRTRVAGAAILDEAGEPQFLARQTAALVGWGVPLGPRLWAEDPKPD